MNEYISRLRDLLKARDLSKLVKKRIVNKKGFGQTVYVKTDVAEKMGKKVKKYHREHGVTESADFADPKNNKYAIHTKQHTRASMAYFSRHHGKYAEEDKQNISRRLVSAAKKHGLNVSDEWKNKVGHKEKEFGQSDAFEKVNRSRKWFKDKGYDVKAMVDQKGNMRMAIKKIGQPLMSDTLVRGSVKETGDLLKKLKERVSKMSSTESTKPAEGKEKQAVAKADFFEGHELKNGFFVKE